MTQEKLETKTCPIYETCGQKEENSQKTREVLCEDLYEHCSKYKSVKALENAIFKSYSSIKDELRI